MSVETKELNANIIAADGSPQAINSLYENRATSLDLKNITSLRKKPPTITPMKKDKNNPNEAPPRPHPKRIRPNERINLEKDDDVFTKERDLKDNFACKNELFKVMKYEKTIAIEERAKRLWSFILKKLLKEPDIIKKTTIRISPQTKRIFTSCMQNACKILQFVSEKYLPPTVTIVGVKAPAGMDNNVIIEIRLINTP